MPETMSDLLDHAFTLPEISASMSSDASIGVSVFPSSVTSGAALPLVSAVCHLVVRLAQGTQTTLILVLAYCGYLLWNWLKIPFSQVTWAGVDGPMRHSVSCAGAAEAEAEADGELPLEPHAAAAPASTTAAPTAASDLSNFTHR